MNTNARLIKSNSGSSYCMLLTLTLVAVAALMLFLLSVWTLSNTIHSENSLPLFDLSNDVPEAYEIERGKLKLITNFSLTLHCGFFLLIPVYAILLFAFYDFVPLVIEETPLIAKEALPSFSCSLIERNEEVKEQSEADNEEEVPVCSKKKLRHNYSQDNFECLQTNCDSPSDESFISQTTDTTKFMSQKGLAESASIVDPNAISYPVSPILDF